MGQESTGFMLVASMSAANKALLPLPVLYRERVGVRGSLRALDSWRQPLTRRYAPTSPREERGEVTS